MASLRAETEQQRRERTAENAHRLRRTGRVRPDLDDDLLVLSSGWEVEAYAAFAAQSMIDALLTH